MSILVRVVPISVYESATPREPDTGLVPPFLPQLSLRCHTIVPKLVTNGGESEGPMSETALRQATGLIIKASATAFRPNGAGVPVIARVALGSPAGQAGVEAGVSLYLRTPDARPDVNRVARTFVVGSSRERKGRKGNPTVQLQ